MGGRAIRRSLAVGAAVASLGIAGGAAALAGEPPIVGDGSPTVCFNDLCIGEGGSVTPGRTGAPGTPEAPAGPGPAPAAPAAPTPSASAPSSPARVAPATPPRPVLAAPRFTG